MAAYTLLNQNVAGEHHAAGTYFPAHLADPRSIYAWVITLKKHQLCQWAFMADIIKKPKPLSGLHYIWTEVKRSKKLKQRHI